MDNNEFSLDMVSIRLVKEAPIMSNDKITTPNDAILLVGNMMCEMDRELVSIINMKTDGTPINCSIVSIGALGQTIANPREMLKAAILSNAAGMIMVHNHPSGSLTPSKNDVIITDRMMQVTELLGIHLLDHIIVGTDMDRYFSFREKKILNNPSMIYKTSDKHLDFQEASILNEIGKFIDENIAIIMIENLIFIFIAVMIAIVLALFGVLSEQEFKIMLLMAALPMHCTILFDVIYMIFF